MKPRSYIPTVSEIEAILAGRKTRFSVPIKPQPDDNGLWNHTKFPMSLESTLEGWWGTVEETGEDREFSGFWPGMLVYCREKWFPAAINADYVLIGYGDPDNVQTLEIQVEDEGPYWRSLERERLLSPATMPKEAARIILRVVGVKVERVQDISEEDARKEGYPVIPSPGTLTEEGMRLMTPQRWFSEQWGRRTRYNPALANPWIFAVHFEVASTQGWDGING